MITGTLEGLGELLTNISRAETAARVATGQKARDLSGELVEDMKGRVEVARGVLRDSIRAEENKDGTMTVRAGGTPETARPTKSGTTYDEAVLLEYGTIHMPAEPFFNPAVEARRDEIGEAMVQAVEDEIGDL